MLSTTHAIVLRSVRYGESSLITTAFTRLYGIQSFLMKGARAGTKGRSGRAGLLQPATLLEVALNHKPGQSLQHMREFNSAYLYAHLREDIVKNSIALFSVELLLRLLPPDAPQEDLFDFSADYFQKLDVWPADVVANFPLYFLIQCSNHLGYTVNGAYSETTPYLNLSEGGFSAHPPVTGSPINEEDTRALVDLLRARSLDDVPKSGLNGAMRGRLMQWYLQFLHRHTDHMAPIKSLDVLAVVLR